MAYYEDWEDCFSEPSVADQIIEKAKSDLYDLLNDEVKQTIEKAESAKDRLDEIECGIREKERKLRFLEERIARMEKEAEEADKYKMPRKYIQKFVSEATGNYAPGDTVWAIKHIYQQTDCPTCNGQKNVAATINGVEFRMRCPTCGGYGYKVEHPAIIKKMRVDRVDLRLCFHENRVSYWSTESVFLDREDCSTNPNSIFRTEEEARAALEKKEDR